MEEDYLEFGYKLLFITPPDKEKLTAMHAGFYDSIKSVKKEANLCAKEIDIKQLRKAIIRHCVCEACKNGKLNQTCPAEHWESCYEPDKSGHVASFARIVLEEGWIPQADGTYLYPH